MKIKKRNLLKIYINTINYWIYKYNDCKKLNN